jgi:hypothetical protein
MSLENLALLCMAVGLTKIGIRFYDLLTKKLAWESQVPQTIFLGKKLIILYIKLLISTFPIFSFKITNRSLRWIHNICVVLIYVLALLVNQRLQHDLALKEELGNTLFKLMTPLTQGVFLIPVFNK